MTIKSIKKLTLLTLIIGITTVSVRLILGGPEDAWECKDGIWVKHGNPNTPQPSPECITKIVN
jgi:hypothetical protein